MFLGNIQALTPHSDQTKKPKSLPVTSSFKIKELKDEVRKETMQKIQRQTNSRSKRRSIHAPNLTNEISTAVERRLNQFGSAV